MRIILWIMIGLMALGSVALEEIYAEPFRLHILAHSDDYADQQVKIKVRDAILRETEEVFRGAFAEEQAEKYAAEHLEKLVRIANEVLRENGFTYTASAEVGSFLFPERTYGARIYPAGEYRALRITLGEGNGHNWWCVLYPPLCMTEITGEDAEIRSYFADWLKGVFS